jgi:hypothetical protein
MTNLHETWPSKTSVGITIDGARTERMGRPAVEIGVLSP